MQAMITKTDSLTQALPHQPLSQPIEGDFLAFARPPTPHGWQIERVGECRPFVLHLVHTERMERVGHELPNRRRAAGGLEREVEWRADFGQSTQRVIDVARGRLAFLR